MALVQPVKNGGPYTKKEQEERKLDVYHLYFEENYSAVKIAEMLNVHRNTINEDIKFWNRKQPDDKITIWKDDGEFCGPDETTFEWNIPKKYLKLDIEELAAEKFAEMGFDGNTVYEDRLVWELGQMRKQEMYPFIRCLVYVIDEFRKHDILWGVGRGSSCSSLVMFILGINRVDPIKYNIDPKEFFK